MGCMCAKNETKEPVIDVAVPKKSYSWDEAKQFFKPIDFIIENLNGDEEIRFPGSVNGQQFIIQNCKDSTIYVLDYINTISIDDCINCKIILGPVQGSAFIRNCKSCTCVVACGQFRMRDSYKINAFLYSATQPIIEASNGIRFGNYQLLYKNIQDHLEKANLDLNNKNWKVVYDFTPMECEENWTFISNENVSEYIDAPKSDAIKNELIKLEHSWSLPQKLACHTT